jgi:hypothetical protein
MEIRQYLTERLIEKAMKDEDFRRELIEFPNETIEKEFGFKMPELVHVKVLEENANTVYIVLPTSQQEFETELTDNDLQRIAGGTWAYTDIDRCFNGPR